MRGLLFLAAIVVAIPGCNTMYNDFHEDPLVAYQSPYPREATQGQRNMKIKTLTQAVKQH